MFIDFRERGRERDINLPPPECLPTRDRVCSLGLCPDWEWNLQHFSVWDDVPTPEPAGQGWPLTFNSTYEWLKNY